MISEQEKEHLKMITILYVEDEDEIRDVLTRSLTRIAKKVYVAKNGKEALETFIQNSPDIVITDIKMPIMDGLTMSKEIKKLNYSIPIIITTAFSDKEFLFEAINIGINRYITKPINLKNLMKTLSESVEAMVLSKKMTQIQEEKIKNYKETIFSFVDMIEKRDTYTAGHTKRVAEYSVLLAKELDCSTKEIEMLREAAILHDIGKIATPDSVLLKPSKLNDVEYDLIKGHVLTGYEFLIKIDLYKELAQIMKYHHERYDGKGYPYGISDDNIPKLSAIMALADSFDAMTTNRVYKRSKTKDEALEEIEKLSGMQFNPKVVKIARKALSNVDTISSIDQFPTTELETKRFAYFFSDPLTGAYNISYLQIILMNNKESKKYKVLNLILLHNFSTFNSKNGWNKGDEILLDFAEYLQIRYLNKLLFRLHGDDFIILSEEDLKIDSQILKEESILKDTNIIIEIKTIDLTLNNIKDVSELDF